MNTAPWRKGQVYLCGWHISCYICWVSIKYRSRVSQYTGWVEFYCGSSISWQIDHQSVTIAMVVCWQCVGKPLVEFQWGIEWWCISWKSASPIQPHPQCFALCYKAPVRWHAEDAINLLITPIGRGWYQTDQLHQIVGYFHVLANISVICWLTYRLLWTTVDQGIGRYVN